MNLSVELFQELFGWLGTVITVLSFLLPIFPYIKVLRGKLDFESTPAFLVTIYYVNYLCWYIYGDMIVSDQIQYCYFIGSIVNFVLMAIYLIYEVRRYLVDTILNTLILITGTWALYKTPIFLINNPRTFGIFCIGTSFIVFISQIQIIYKVIKEKNYILIPIYNCYFIFLYSICWLVYGICLICFIIIVPNAIAILLAFIEIIIYWYYKRKYSAIGERLFSPIIGIEDTSTEKDSKKEEAP